MTDDPEMKMMTMDCTVMDEAIGWHLRQRDMAAQDWERFVAWLERSPANAAAYDRVAADDRLLDEVPALVASPAPAARPLAPAATAFVGRRPVGAAFGRRPWLAGVAAIAATLVIVVAPLSSLSRGGSAGSFAVETRAGEHRSLTLADGTRVTLDGATRLRLDRGEPRVAFLDHGAAEFRVTHDAAHPFAVRSGGVTVRDMGTVFEMSRSGARLDVAVAEGSVVFQPAADAVSLTAGHRLALDEAHGRVTLGTVAAGDVGGWRGDRLGFSGEPLASVAAALQRRYGTPVVLAADLPDRPFTGMVRLSGSAERDVPHLAALIGADWRHEGGQWILAPERARTR